jgi:hypothetical protein
MTQETAAFMTHVLESGWSNLFDSTVVNQYSASVVTFSSWMHRTSKSKIYVLDIKTFIRAMSTSCIFKGKKRHGTTVTNINVFPMQENFDQI